MTDITNKTPEELQAIIVAATEQLQVIQHNKYKKVVAQIKELAHSIGVTVEIHDDGKKVRKTLGVSVPAKYRNPNDSQKTWTGRGMTPKWLQDYIADGHEKNECLIN